MPSPSETAASSWDEGATACRTQAEFSLLDDCCAAIRKLAPADHFRVIARRVARRAGKDGRPLSRVDDRGRIGVQVGASLLCGSRNLRGDGFCRIKTLGEIASWKLKARMRSGRVGFVMTDDLRASLHGLPEAGPSTGEQYLDPDEELRSPRLARRIRSIRETVCGRKPCRLPLI